MDVIGVVREFIDEVNVFNRFGICENPFSYAILGPIATTPFAQITIQTGALMSTDNYNLTFLVDKKLLMQQKVLKNSVIHCQLRGLEIMELKPILICDQSLRRID